MDADDLAASFSLASFNFFKRAFVGIVQPKT
jgi:hypothetical protein